MTVAVVLNNLSDGYSEEVIIENVENRTCFSYTDNDKNNCEMCVYDDGICFFKESDDHILELHLRGNYYAKITTVEGILKFDAKVVDFNVNNDILVMRYIVNDEERIIEIRYY